MKTKGDISINVLIIAIVGLIVLTVLVAVFGGKMANWIKNTESIEHQKCLDLGGQIVKLTESCPEGYEAALSKYDDVNPGFKCCLQAVRTEVQ